MKIKLLHSNFPNTIGLVCVTDSKASIWERSDTQSWVCFIHRNWSTSLSVGLQSATSPVRARAEPTRTDPHQHLFPSSSEHRAMEWFRLGGVPGGMPGGNVLQTLAHGRANFKARSRFFNKLLSRYFREGLWAKPIILHVSSDRFVLMTKSKQCWSPRCNWWQILLIKLLHWRWL